MYGLKYLTIVWVLLSTKDTPSNVFVSLLFLWSFCFLLLSSEQLKVKNPEKWKR